MSNSLFNRNNTAVMVAINEKYNPKKAFFSITGKKKLQTQKDSNRWVKKKSTIQNLTFWGRKKGIWENKSTLQGKKERPSEKVWNRQGKMKIDSIILRRRILQKNFLKNPSWYWFKNHKRPAALEQKRFFIYLSKSDPEKPLIKDFKLRKPSSSSKEVR